MATFTFLVGDGAVQYGYAGLNLSGADNPIWVHRTTNGVEDKIFIDVSAFATSPSPDDVVTGGGTFQVDQDIEVWIYADTPGYNFNSTVQDKFYLTGLPEGWSYALTDTVFGSTAPNGRYYTAAEWQGLGFRYLQLYDEFGEQMTSDRQIWLLGVVDNITVVPCFAGAGTHRVVDGVETFEDTWIRRPDGSEAPVDSFREGDLVQTLDNGAQPVRWLGKSVYDADYLAQFPQHRPIRFRPGALGNARELLVSPQHCMLLEGDWAEALTGRRKAALVPAKALVNDSTITVDHDVQQVCYYHLMFDRHEIVAGNGILSESFNPGPYAMQGLGAAARSEVVTMFPEFDGPDAARNPARPILRPGQMKKIQKQVRVTGL